MSRVVSRRKRATRNGELDWENIEFVPNQGRWSEEDYLAIETARLIEYDNGRLELLPVPTTSHQRLLIYLLELLRSFVEPKDLGEALFCGTRVRTLARKYREPDIVFVLNENLDRIGELFWEGADLAMEVVSGGSEGRRRDLVKKRREYARAGIAEYWIIDPKNEQITVLRLANKAYEVHGEYKPGDTATSHLLPGFTVDVTTAFARRGPTAPRLGKRRK